MEDRKRVLLFLILAVVLLIFFNFQYLGWSISNTTSNVTVIPANYYPTFVGDLNDSLFVCEGSQLYYAFNASDLDGDVVSGDITPENPFYVFWISQVTPNVQTLAIVSGTITKTNAGGVNVGSRFYRETVSINDGYLPPCCENTTEVNITAIEINNAPVIEDVGVQTIYTQGDNSTFYKQLGYDDPEYNLGYGNVNFNISFNGGTELFNITSGGVINFTANSSTVAGVYNITLCINDTGLTNAHQNISNYCGQTGGVMSDCDNFTLTVTNENRAPNITSYYPSGLTFNSASDANLYFNISAYDADGTIPDAYWYVDEVFVEKDSGNSLDEFNYNFGCGVDGVHNVSIEITDGLVNDSMQWNVTLSASDCGGGGGSSSGGGGGGGGGAQVIFSVSPEFITTTLIKGEGQSYDITIVNNGQREFEFSMSLQNLTNMAIVNDNKFLLKPGETKITKLYLYALKSTAPGVYFGKIIVSAGGVKKAVNVVMEVKDREALFDIKVSVLPEYKLVNPGKDINVSVDLLNVGLYGNAVDVELYLYITDFDKLILYELQKETLAVKTNLSIPRRLYVPLDTLAGTYLVIGEAKYGNITASTYDTFNVTQKKYLKTGYILLIFIIILLILFILFLIWKRRKREKEKIRNG